MSKKRITLRARIYTDSHRSKVEYYLIPANPAAYEQMVEQVAKGIMTCWPGTVLHDIWRKEARAALRAIGITPPKKGRTCSS